MLHADRRFLFLVTISAVKRIFIISIIFFLGFANRGFFAMTAAATLIAGVNFVFDKDVRGDVKVTVFLRQVSLDEALRVILATQQLDRGCLTWASVQRYAALATPAAPAADARGRALRET